MRFFLIVILISVSRFGLAQYLDLAKVEYSYLPGRDANVEYQRQRVLFNIPFKVGEKGHFFSGLNFSNIHFVHKETTDSYDKQKTGNFKTLDLTLSYIRKLKNDWYVGLQVAPGFRSNLEGRPNQSDLLFSTLIVFVKDRIKTEAGEKPHRLILGVYYISTSRFNGPFPFFSYYKKFHKRWSYTFGAPTSNIKYYAGEKHRIQFMAEGDGFNSHLQGGVVVQDNLPADRLRLFLILAGVRYEYQISHFFEAYANVTHSVFSNVQLRKKKENVFVPDIDDGMLYRVGVRCKI